jgi:hypothetical protein
MPVAENVETVSQGTYGETPRVRLFVAWQCPKAIDRHSLRCHDAVVSFRRLGSHFRIVIEADPKTARDGYSLEARLLLSHFQQLYGSAQRRCRTRERLAGIVRSLLRL